MFNNPDLNIKTLVYSSHEAGGIIAHSLSKEIGAFGYVSKNSDCDTILCALEAIAKGEKFIQPNLLTSYINAQTKLNLLTNREQEILNCVFAKYTNDEIAQNLKISKRSIENYLSRIYDKTGTNNKQQLIEYIEKN
jgi:DNA-binding NarL/FixJ family response regulator